MTWCCLLLASFTCSAAGLTVTVVDHHGQPVADAVVVLRAPADDGAPANAPQGGTVTQLDTRFVPHVLAIQVGARVAFPNQDPFLHHVYSFSPAKPFDLELYARDSLPVITFDQPGVVAIGCNIHDSMRGYIYVADSPWFAVTDAAGQAIFSAFAAGAHSVEVWHPRQLGESARQTLDAQVTQLSVSVHLKPSPQALQPFEAGAY